MSIKKQKDPLIKQFMTSREVDLFLRFVHENDLRHEAKVLLKIVVDRIKRGNKKSK